MLQLELNGFDVLDADPVVRIGIPSGPFKAEKSE